MADTEFRDEERIELLEALKTALESDTIPSQTAWACLWLSDIDRLRCIVHDAQMNRIFAMAFFRDMESNTKIVQKCLFIT